MTRLLLPLLAIAVLPLVACGGDDGGSPPAGPFVKVTGSLPHQNKTFSLTKVETCTFKPGLKELEYKGSSAGGDSLHVLIKDYGGQSPYELKLRYGVREVRHRIDVELAGGYRYIYFQHVRSDVGKVFPTVCNVLLTSEEAGDKVRHSGVINCAQLWADLKSKDYDGSSLLNANVDMTGRFTCERPNLD